MGSPQQNSIFPVPLLVTSKQFYCKINLEQRKIIEKRRGEILYFYVDISRGFEKFFSLLRWWVMTTVREKILGQALFTVKEFFEKGYCSEKNSGQRHFESLNLFLRFEILAWLLSPWNFDLRNIENFEDCNNDARVIVKEYDMILVCEQDKKTYPDKNRYVYIVLPKSIETEDIDETLFSYTITKGSIFLHYGITDRDDLKIFNMILYESFERLDQILQGTLDFFHGRLFL